MQLDLPCDKAVVLCLVKNGEIYIDEFVDYYQAMGFSHVVFLDNGSGDETIQRACNHNNVTVLQSLADYKTCKVTMKDSLMRLFGRGTWSLIADIDEFFQYPLMDSLTFDHFITYLNKNCFTSLVSYMIDMVPNTTFGEIYNNTISSIQSGEWYFDYSNIDRYPYPEPTNEISNPDIDWWYGGIRKVLFGPNICISKHPFNFGDDKLKTLSSHITANRRIADISGLLLHYKYVGDVYNHAQQAVLEKNYYMDSREYRLYLEKFNNDKSKHFTLPSSIKYENHRTMVEHNLLTLSQQYLEFVSKVGKTT